MRWWPNRNHNRLTASRRRLRLELVAEGADDWSLAMGCWRWVTRWIVDDWLLGVGSSGLPDWRRKLLIRPTFESGERLLSGRARLIAMAESQSFNGKP